VSGSTYCIIMEIMNSISARMARTKGLIKLSSWQKLQAQTDNDGAGIAARGDELLLRAQDEGVALAAVQQQHRGRIGPPLRQLQQ
jgi:hypothetical protein